jgi:hypothetical protein
LKALQLEIQMVQLEIQQEQVKAAKKATQSAQAGQAKDPKLPESVTGTATAELLNQLA